MPDLKRVALTLVIAVALGACVPPPPPSPAYERCSNVGPDQCSLFYVAAWGGTHADREAWTTEPPTFISIELTLEKKPPDGTFTRDLDLPLGAGVRGTATVLDLADDSM